MVKSDRPIVKAALVLLARAFPGYVSIDELLERGQALIGDEHAETVDTDRAALIRALVSTASGGLLELSVRPPRFAAAPGERPRASPLARLELGEGPLITTLTHYSYLLEDSASQHLLGLLDGTRTHAELLDAMRAFFVAHNAPPLESGEPRPSPEEFERVLANMARQAFLVA